MDIRPGDILQMKKKHPCGGDRWKVTRVGMDFRMTCLVCGREIMIPRSAAEKGMKKLIREECS